MGSIEGYAVFNFFLHFDHYNNEGFILSYHNNLVYIFGLDKCAEIKKIYIWKFKQRTFNKFVKDIHFSL